MIHEIEDFQILYSKEEYKQRDWDYQYAIRIRLQNEPGSELTMDIKFKREETRDKAWSEIWYEQATKHLEVFKRDFSIFFTKD